MLPNSRPSRVYLISCIWLVFISTLLELAGSPESSEAESSGLEDQEQDMWGESGGKADRLALCIISGSGEWWLVIVPFRVIKMYLFWILTLDLSGSLFLFPLIMSSEQEFISNYPPLQITAFALCGLSERPFPSWSFFVSKTWALQEERTCVLRFHLLLPFSSLAGFIPWNLLISLLIGKGVSF